MLFMPVFYLKSRWAFRHNIFLVYFSSRLFWWFWMQTTNAQHSGISRYAKDSKFPDISLFSYQFTLLKPKHPCQSQSFPNNWLTCQQNRPQERFFGGKYDIKIISSEEGFIFPSQNLLFLSEVGRFWKVKNAIRKTFFSKCLPAKR